MKVIFWTLAVIVLNNGKIKTKKTTLTRLIFTVFFTGYYDDIRGGLNTGLYP